jgi:seryl-tRNA synthetase
MNEKRKTVKELEAEILEIRKTHAEEVAKLKKEVEEKDSYYKMYSKKDDEHRAEIAQLHQMIDSFPGAPPREVPGDRYGATNPIIARLAGWLASRVFVAPPQ